MNYTNDTSAHDSGQCPICESKRIGFLKDSVGALRQCFDCGSEWNDLMEITINAKESDEKPKYLFLQYGAGFDVELPDDIDWEQVKDIGVKWDSIFLYLKNGDIKSIQFDLTDCDIDYKRPTEITLFNDEWGEIELGDDE